MGVHIKKIQLKGMFYMKTHGLIMRLLEIMFALCIYIESCAANLLTVIKPNEWLAFFSFFLF